MPLGPPDRGTIDPALVGTWTCVDPKDASNTATVTAVAFDAHRRSHALRSVRDLRPEGAGDTVNLLLRDGTGDRPAHDAGTDLAPHTGGPPRIRCPRCAWEPGRGDRWTCACLFVWNTFETGGVCPSCQRQWLETQCPKCDGWSPHLAWYVDDDAPGH